jgi:leader peptidase (prepilin peptidase)/N-methyltransferase
MRLMTAFLLALLQDPTILPPAFSFIVVGALGAIIGSFLNVVIHRLPLDESIVFPNSRCPSCSTVIAFYDNVPVLSYLALRGRCRFCKVRISPRYPAVEILTALLFVAVVWRYGVTPALPFELVFVSAMVALIFIDAENMILPNLITYPGIVFSVLARLAIPYLMGRPYFDDLEGLSRGLFSDWPLWAASLGGAVLAHSLVAVRSG